MRLRESRTTLFINREGRPIVEKSNCFGRRPYYLWLQWQPKVESGVFSSNIANRVYHGRTVIINLCLPIAHYMGFSEIYLLGCDCDYNIDLAAEQSQDHFYDEDIVRHYGDNAPLSRTELQLALNYFDNYKVVKRYFDATRRQIFNAGVGGKLEIFPRIPLEEVLAQPAYWYMWGY